MKQSKFMLLLGPSGVGKSTIIKELCQMDARFVYISPDMTRPLRDGEMDKVSITDAEMNVKSVGGQYVTINTLFNGIRYATPRQPIIDALNSSNYPLLDWPIAKLGTMMDSFPGRLYVIYVVSPSLSALAERIAKDGRDIDGSRYQSAKLELEAFWAGEYCDQYQLAVTTENDRIPEIAQMIYSAYLTSLPRSSRKR